jgi:two-component system, NtrC family, sensor kinase
MKTSFLILSQKHFRHLCMSVGFLLCFMNTYAQPIIHLNSDDMTVLAGQSCLVKSDSANKYSIENILKENTFETNPNEHILMGVGEKQNVWLKWNILNPQPEFAFLEFTFPALDTVTLYIVEDGKIVETQMSGESFAPTQRFVESKNIIFKIRQSPKTLTYYFKVKARWFCNIKPRITTIKAYIRMAHFDDIIQGLFLGIAGIFVLYNLFVFVQLKNTVYLYYSLYLSTISIFVMRHNGFTTEFLFRTTPQYNDILFVMVGLSGLFGTLFTIKFLETKQNVPKIHRIFQGLLVVYILLTILLASKEMYWTVILSQVLIPIGTALVFVTSTFLWWKGNAHARYYFIGWFILFVLQMVFIMENRGALPSNFFTTYSTHIGIAAEAIILSYAIADRFRMLKVNDEQSQLELISALKVNEQLTLEKNKTLEEKVEARTSELKVAMKQVMDSEVKLHDYAMRLEKSNKELTDFASIASHDLKAPIRGILSFIQLLERRSKPKFDVTDLEYFNFIKNNAHHSAQLIEDILNYSKIDKDLGDPKEVDLNKSIFMAEMNLKSIIDDIGAEVTFDTMPYIKGHSALIVQLFQNLIANGLKYNKAAKPTVHVGVSMADEADVVFSIKDNGIGIAPENHEKIFSMFRRLHTQDEYEGTGIGLAFCTRIVNTYGGQIWLESAEGEGTTFFFTLPKAFPYAEKKIATLKAVA